MKNFFLPLIMLLAIALKVDAKIDARMLRQPDVSATHITFVYAGDIWIVPKSGGVAMKLSSPLGEESFPRFSPDGNQIAFSGNYSGNTDVYIVPTLGGIPQRLTHHPMGDRLVDWRPNGKEVFFASGRESGSTRFNKLFSVSLDGGMAVKMPFAYGEFGAYSPDENYFAYMPETYDFSTWKRYRGGAASDIWLYDFKTKAAQNITNSEAGDGHPMWFGKFIYFLSDRGANQRQNIWKYSLDTKQITQVTNFKDFDISFPAIGPKDIVFENGGKLYLLDLATEKYKEVEIEVVTDLATLAPKSVNVSSLVSNATISPSGQRVVVEARGELFNLPAKDGFIKNLTKSSGVAETYPAYSPDGKYIAYWSDKTGENQLTLLAPDGSGKEKVLTDYKDGYKYKIFWSPNSKMVAFIQNNQWIQIFDIDKNELIKVDRTIDLGHPALNGFELNWSSDSKWITYSKTIENTHSAIFLYNIDDKKIQQVTTGFYSDDSPVFDPDGKYLFFLTNRSLNPLYSSLDDTWIYPNTTQIASVSLRKDVSSLLAPKNDEEKPKEEKKAEEKKEEKPNGEKGKELKAVDEKNKDVKKEDAKKDDKAKEEKKDDKKVEPLKIDLDGFESRLEILPPKAGNYSNLRAVKGKVLFIRNRNAGVTEGQTPLVAYNMEKREEETILDNSTGFEVSADGKKLLANDRATISVIDAAPKQKMENRLRTAELEMTINPKEEWKQLFSDVWRRYRDFFYDADLHKIDWNDLRKQYGKLIDESVTRWDVNFVIGSLISELSSSHTYVGGGDVERANIRNNGLLGVDWVLENGAYKVARIVDGAKWDNEVRSPLKQTGLKIKEGDYILAVNGNTIDISKDPWAAFEGLGGKTVSLTVNDKPTLEGAKEIIVSTLPSEMRLRNLEWINHNREYVEKLSGGKVGYIYMPNTGGNGQTELIRQYHGQLDKEAFIIDERFNSGGQLPARFIELINRPIAHQLQFRDRADQQYPLVANNGPKVMLINGQSVSGGDAFPYVFKSQKVGPIVGTRTMGALIGPATGHTLMDGGFITCPDGRIFDNQGKWFPENHGVEPDIKVIDDPNLLMQGKDPQLERGVEEALKLIKTNPRLKVKHPEYEDRTADGYKRNYKK